MAAFFYLRQKFNLMGLFHRWTVNLLFALAALVYFSGMFLEVMDVDSAQYASIAREMLDNGQFLEIQHQGRDYLDKPPLLFWTTAAFYYLFGIHDWTFRLSSILFSILGIISTYKLGHLLYNKRTGFISAVVLMTSQAFILMNHDVRTDTILTNAIVFAVWKITEFLYYQQRRDLIWGFTGIAIAMMAKGPLGLMVPALAIGSYLIGRKRYKDLFRKEWIIGIFWVLLLLAPMTYGLYKQFDLHPEKELLFLSDAGNTYKTGVSGVKFFYWTQSFGRLTGENVWKDQSGPFFFVHTFLWAFLPWALIAIVALFWRIYNAIRDILKGNKKQEWLTLGGFILPFLALSTSGYKLPHYINVVFPFAAIITAEFILRVIFEMKPIWKKLLNGTQLFISILLLLLASLVLFWFFPQAPWYVYLLTLSAFGAAIGLAIKGNSIERAVIIPAFAALGTNIVANMHFYPELMKYQPSDEAAHFVLENHLPISEILMISPSAGHSMEYYSRAIYPKGDVATLLENKQFNYAYTGDVGYNEIASSGIKFEVLKDWETIHVTMLSIGFLDPSTRKDEVGHTYLLKIEH